MIPRWERLFLYALLAAMLAITAHLRAAAPKHDGKTDDIAALQYQVDHAYRVQLVSGATYLISDNLRIRKTTILESTIPGKPATILYDRGPRPYNKVHIDIAPELGPEHWWNEKLSAGIRPTTRPAAGKRYAVGYGSDPFDVNEERFVGFSDSGGLPAAPDDIEGDHWYAEILRSPDGTVIRDIELRQADGTVIDYSIGVKMTRGCLIQNISGTFYIGIQLIDSESVAIDGMKGTALIYPGHTSSGRAISAWQSRGVTVNNLDISASDRVPAFFLESWCDGVVMQNIRIRLRAEADQSVWPPCSPIWFSNGGSRTMAVLSARIDTEKMAGLYLWDCGGQQSEPPRFGLVQHRGVIVDVSNVRIEKLIKVPAESN